MVIDTKEIVDNVVASLLDGAHAFERIDLLDVGVGLIGIGLILGANVQFQKWRKNRGYRMVLKERRDKINRLEADILTNGLLDAELRGEISRKEHDEELQRLSDKFGLPDLIPPKRRARIVKNEIKARLNKSPKGTKPSTPITGKPKAFREKVGTFANQFWRTRRA